MKASVVCKIANICWIRPTQLPIPGSGYVTHIRNFMCQSLSREVNSWSVNQKIPSFHATRRFFFNSLSVGGGGGVQLSPLGTAATDWPIVACPG
jgi:hypothetical protein